MTARARQMDGDRPVVSIVIVSYNTLEMTRACLASIDEQAGGVSYEVIVVDNGSHDGSVEMIRREFPWVELVDTGENNGFARGNNIGFERARGRQVLLLNSDTELRGDAVGASSAELDAHPRAGVVGCRAWLPDGRQQMTIFRFLRPSDLLINAVVPDSVMRRSRLLGRKRYVGIDLDQAHEVEVVAGCFMLVRREVIEEVGGLDEDFFMYGEEAEWCFRIRRAGWTVRYFPGASILHHGGGSAKKISERMARAMVEGQLLFLRKTRGRLVARCCAGIMLARDGVRALVWGVAGLAPSRTRERVRSSLHASRLRVPVLLRYVARGTAA